MAGDEAPGGVRSPPATFSHGDETLGGSGSYVNIDAEAISESPNALPSVTALQACSLLDNMLLPQSRI
jgi:hypothetical protein